MQRNTQHPCTTCNQYLTMWSISFYINHNKFICNTLMTKHSAHKIVTSPPPSQNTSRSVSGFWSFLCCCLWQEHHWWHGFPRPACRTETSGPWSPGRRWNCIPCWCSQSHTHRRRTCWRLRGIEPGVTFTIIIYSVKLIN